MTVTRRMFVASTVLAATAPMLFSARSLAQDATPMAADPGAPGYGIVRVRALPTPELNQAVFPDVMYRFLPETSAISGYFGYLFAFDNDNPAASLTLTLLTDEVAVDAANEVAQNYVAGLDPRLTPETPFAEQGPIQIYATTDRPASELPPHLTGCQVKFRPRVNAPETDIDAIVQSVQDDLVPNLIGLDGFVLFGWVNTSEGRCSFTIFETSEQLAASDAVIAEYISTHPVITAQGDPVDYTGTIGYADVLGNA